MNDNNSMLGGTIRRHFMKNYANYIVKFLQGYRGEGVEVNAVTPQNEVDTDQDSRMPACLFPQGVEVQYVAEMLGPAIEQAGLPRKIWLNGASIVDNRTWPTIWPVFIGHERDDAVAVLSQSFHEFRFS